MPNRNLSLIALVLFLGVTAYAQPSVIPGGGSVGGQGFGVQGPRWVQPAGLSGTAIELAIQAAYRNGGRVYLPGGTYLVSSTINLAPLGPILIEGEAMGTPDGWRGRGGVELKWAGPPGGIMIRLQGFGVTFRNIMLNGNNTAGMGIQLFSRMGGGGAINLYESMMFIGFTDAAFQAGQALNEVNSADQFFDRVIFNNGNVGFRVVHDQGVNFQFDRCSFGGLKTALEINRGGSVYVRGGSGGACDTFLRTGEGGHNTGPIVIRDYRFENSGHTRKYAQMLDAPDSPGGTRVVFDGLSMANAGYPNPDQETPTFKIGANVQVHVRDSNLKRAGDWPLAQVRGNSNYKASLTIENSESVNDPTLSSIVKNEQSRVQVLTGSAPPEK